jgi:hypothetical protein
VAKRPNLGAPRGSPARSKKQDLKERAQREREEIRRKAQTRRRYRIIAAVGVPGLVAAVIVGVLLANRATDASPKVSSGGLPGLQTGPPPWSPELQHLRDRLQTLGLPAQASMAETIHFHAHLDLYVNGQAVEVPQNIGINEAEGFLTSVHTHDRTGIIHIESPTEGTFTLGEFFDVWGVRFTASCVGGSCNSGDKALKVFMNGVQVTQDPRAVQLSAHEEVVVAYGTPAQLPSPVPSSYQFPTGV